MIKVYVFVIIIFALMIHFDDGIPFLETEWFQSYWTISIPIAIVYVALIVSLPNWIRKPIKCLEYLRIWNFTLMIFSVMATYRLGMNFVEKIYQRGLRASYCDRDYHHDRRVYYWYFLFVSSKLFEMGDTIFLLARQKRIRFIHWFHHVLTMIYSWYIAVYLPAIGRWMSTMNTAIHSLMYGYYYLQSCQIRLPGSVAITVTILQTSQMFIGLTINSLAFYEKWMITDSNCSNGGYTVESGLVMYIIYVALFTHLFRKEMKRHSLKNHVIKRAKLTNK
ncbi:Elongation of very long chain fatty acids protein 6 [Dermatophagoides farinae]|uniref:Elongation of very long chain fatty acids protein n=1 Tax=Dermatophagoides farinae TaxID=6954 RepID=A0A922L084_DERFA|nr:Elongation of very long chain fatty acids protein 6 [Dermatophagoides farinae]